MTPTPQSNINSSPRAWKDQTKEWGWHKNIPQGDMQWIVAKGTKRAQEGKDTAYFYGETQVTARKIENFKRRKTAEVPDNMRELFYSYHPLVLFN